MLDFPSAPTVGQKYPAAPIGGVPTYVWDGEKWTTAGGAMGGKLPIWSDGTQAMAAQLSLINPPVNPTDAVAKAYVDTRVRHDIAQGLLAASQMQARQNIAAPSAEALAFNGMQTNGVFEVNQEFGTNGKNFVCSAANVTTADTYVADGWKIVATGGGAGAFLINHTIGAVTGGNNWFPRCLQTYITGHGFYLDGAGDYCIVRHFIEGYRMRQLGFGWGGAMPVTLAFWFTNNGGIGGNMGVSLRNVNASRNITNAVAIKPGAGYNYYTTTFPGDISGTWNSANGIGFFLDFIMCANSSLWDTTTGVWGPTAKFGAPNQAHFMAADLASQFSGVVLLPGSEAPPAEYSSRLIRPYQHELATAQRGFYLWGAGDNGITGSPRSVPDTYRVFGGVHPVQMRSTPTITASGVLNYAGGQVGVGCNGGLNTWEGGLSLADATHTFVMQNFKADARM